MVTRDPSAMSFLPLPAVRSMATSVVGPATAASDGPVPLCVRDGGRVAREHGWDREKEIYLDVVESLIGPDIALWSSHFLCKPAGTGKRAPWHEDSAYWGQVLDPMEVVTIWLAIDPSTPENGCMRVLS